MGTRTRKTSSIDTLQAARECFLAGAELGQSLKSTPFREIRGPYIDSMSEEAIFVVEYGKRDGKEKMWDEFSKDKRKDEEPDF